MLSIDLEHRSAAFMKCKKASVSRSTSRSLEVQVSEQCQGPSLKLNGLSDGAVIPEPAELLNGDMSAENKQKRQKTAAAAAARRMP